MRDILFRGKRIDNGEWVDGVYYKQTEYYGESCERCCIIVSTEDLSFDQDLEFYEVDPETVGQYTGLTDKNGKKIFEYDIVKLGHDVGLVEYSELFGKYIVVYNQLSGNWFDFESDDCSPLSMECEVIGNTIDSPELLKGER